nr:MAG TPA: hypothetical protein [Caudoviricetes sp.]
MPPMVHTAFMMRSAHMYCSVCEYVISNYLLV